MNYSDPRYIANFISEDINIKSCILGAGYEE